LPTVVEYIFPNYKMGYMYTIAEYDVYLTWVLVGSVVSIIVIAINYFGMKSAAIFQMVLTVIIALIGIMLMVGAGFNGDYANAEPLFSEGTAGIITVL